MLKMVDGTGIIGVDMICPLGVSTPQPPNYDRVELEGTGMLVLPNSLDAPLERLELGGKTEQVQTTGKNLLPDKFSIYAEGKSKTNLKLQIGNYVYSSKTSKNLYILHEDKSNITNGWTATNKFNFKIDKEETIEVRIETENPLEILPMIRGRLSWIPTNPIQAVNHPQAQNIRRKSRVSESGMMRSRSMKWM